MFLIEPLNTPRASVLNNRFYPIIYKVINNSNLTRRLTLKPITGILQNPSPFQGANICGKTFILAPNQFCYLRLIAVGAIMQANNISSIVNGPIICKTKFNSDEPDIFLCERPAQTQELNLSLNRNSATIQIDPKNLTLSDQGDPGIINVSNTGSNTAYNISAKLNASNIDNYINQDASDCVNLPPQRSCHLVFTSTGTALASTPALIFGDNTSIVAASLSVINESQASIQLTSGSPMTLQSNSTTQGPSQDFSIQNKSPNLSANNIQAYLDSTLTNLVTITANNCAPTLAPNASCTISVAANANPNHQACVNCPISFSGDNTSVTQGIISVIAPTPVNISINPSSISLNTSLTDGASITVYNNDTLNIAYDIQAIFPPNAQIVLSNNTCSAGVPPGGNCTLSFQAISGATPTTTPVNFTIVGSNTNAVTTQYSITSSPILSSVSPTSIPLTAYNFQISLSGANINVGNASLRKVWFYYTLNGLTDRAAGVIQPNSVAPNNLVVTAPGFSQSAAPHSVTIVVETEYGSSSESASTGLPVTYFMPTLGQSLEGGIVALLAGSVIQGRTTPYTLIITTPVQSANWGPVSNHNPAVVTNATSAEDGIPNTANIVDAFTTQRAYPQASYAAGICNASSFTEGGASSCNAGSPCYTGWYLGAFAEMVYVYTNYHAGALASANLSAIRYWTSEADPDPSAYAPILMDFSDGAGYYDTVNYGYKASAPYTEFRCIKHA